MNRALLFLAAGLFAVHSSFAVELIPGLVSYDPPDFFNVGKAHLDPGDSPASMQRRPVQLSAKDNGYTHFRELNVSLRGVGMSVGEGKRVTSKPVSFDELKTLMATTVLSKRATKAPKVEEFQFAGRRALRLKQTVLTPQMAPGASLIFDFVWVPLDPNHVLEVKPVASNEELLKTIWDSLETFKILRQPDQVLPISKDAAQLGDVRADLAKSVGQAVENGPSYALYFCSEYFFLTNFKMPLVTDISYFRVSDAKLYLTKWKQRDEEGLKALTTVLKSDEIEKLLSKHTVDSSGAKHSWKRLKEGRWERSDGVRAATNNGGRLLVIASKEIWPNLILDEAK